MSKSNGTRVAVTGLGFVTPIGHDPETVWSNLVEGVSGVGTITRFDTTAYPTKIAGEVKGFDAERFMALWADVAGYALGRRRLP